ncbi:TonB-dependent receptor plug domain-containing protein [Segetibacter aerophilus]|uniref:TonB-dependent receptor plug domain-containing protein n=1 Tax=Segetibacter aerophilus TaxID=670293 RepID=UPI0014794CCA|nr:TonB-dependent receptor plug domain-containing protein [Segetibacter aerophilus]
MSVLVSDAASNKVANATVSINQKKFKTDSTGKGTYFIVPGTNSLTVTSVNHYPFSLNLFTNVDTAITIVLQLRASLLGNVTVTTSRNVVRNQMGVQTISATQLRKIPVVLGEVDPLKTITLLPGIKSGGEASAGIYVRGGGPDQNLVLLDGVPVYNPNHLLGFFSIFNGEAVKSVEVIKGGIPAEYGGRLSSVIAIDTRDGNKDSVKGSGGIGLISSRIALEGPLIKGKSSFIVSARRTYIDQVARIVAAKKVGGNGYYFYDINAKADYFINSTNQLVFTLYTGRDRFSFDNSRTQPVGRSTLFQTYWGNTLAGLSWRQQLNKKLSHETALVFNNFALDSRFGAPTSTFLFTSGLQDKQVKTDWVYKRSDWLTFKVGGQYIRHQFKPGAGGVTSGIQEFKSQVSDQYARETAAYISSDVNVTPNLNIIAGLRYSYCNQVGPTRRVVYDNDGIPTGEVQQFSNGQSIAKYHYPEPRLSVLYKLPNTASIKASYTRTIQYLHLATTSGATFPSDLWVPSSELIKPSNAQQVSLGYFKNFGDNTYEASIETHYKVMNNQIEFRPGAQLLLNQNIEGEMIFGSGKAYGVELFVQKKQGKLTGWVGYTLSRAERKFAQLNQGKSFPYRYDRTHDLSIVANYPLNARWEASAVFVYGTGNALTMPTGRFTYNLGYNPGDRTPIFTNINQYSKVNDYRMEAYHRMDIAFTYTPKPNSTKRFKSSWNFSIYNLYNRANPYFLYLEVDDDKKIVQGKKVYLFPTVPSVTWNFKF